MGSILQFLMRTV